MPLPASLKSPRFLGLELLQFLSNVWSWLQTVLLGIVIFSLKNRPLDLSIAFALGALPQAFLSPLGGRIADCFPRRSILLWTQGLMMLQSVLAATQTKSELGLDGLIFAASVLRAFNTPAFQAYMKEVIGSAYEDEMTQSNAWYVDSLLSLLAFALGYFGASLFSELRIYLAAITANVVSFFPIWLLIFFGKAGRGRPVTGIQPSFRLWDAVKHLATLPAASRALLLYTAITVCVGSTSTTLLVTATDVFGRGSYIPLSLAYTVGGFAAGLGLTFFQKRVEQTASWRLYCLLSTLYGVCAASHSLVWELVDVTGIGFLSEAIGAKTRTTLLVSTPKELAGRVSGLFQLSSVGGTGMSSLLAGSLIPVVGVVTTTIGSGLASVLSLVTLRIIFARRKRPPTE